MSLSIGLQVNRTLRRTIEHMMKPSLWGEGLGLGREEVG
jgi:hypothetical protein